MPTDLLALARERAQTNLFWRYLDVQVDEAGDGWVKLRVPVRDPLRNAGGRPRARRRPQRAGGHGGGRGPQHHQRERGGRRGADHPRPQRQLPRRGQRWRDPRGGTAPPSWPQHRRRGQARGGWPRDLHAPLTQVLGPNRGSKETPWPPRSSSPPRCPIPSWTSPAPWCPRAMRWSSASTTIPTSSSTWKAPNTTSASRGRG